MLVKLLKLPLDLPENHPAKLSKGDDLFTRLGDYVSKCLTLSASASAKANSCRPNL